MHWNIFIEGVIIGRGERKLRRGKRLFILGMIILSVCFVGGCTKKGLTVLDQQGNEMEVLKKTQLGKEKIDEKGYRAYLEIVLEEATQIICKEKKVDEEEAEEILLKGNYSVYTNFDKAAYEAIKKSEVLEKDVSFGCAITDLEGNLVAVYSGGDFKEEYQNYAQKKTAPYSSFKPLSVYTPAMEKELITWSTVYKDEPVKQIEESDGTKRDWPANATGIYSEENVSVQKAMKESLNTIAVKCLQDYGVENSLSYMKETFGLNLKFEESRVKALGGEKVIGNVALGYLQEGVSPVEMAGYYQVFANGGKYIEPKTISKICDANGKVIYERKEESKQIVSVETAAIMNRLLQRVVEPGGTGEKARCENVPVGGKTGTGDNGNWFVGFTPEYTCAVWHGKEVDKNSTTEIFSSIISEMKVDSGKKFPETDHVQEVIYCGESGMMCGPNCRKIEKGYYSLKTELPLCDKH